MNFVRHESYSDANFYLRGSLIKYKGDIAMVQEIDEDGITYLRVGNDDENTVVDYETLDLSPINLGYVFSPSQNRTYYIERMPRRQWRQGLTSENTIDRLGSHLEFNPNKDYFSRTVKSRFPSVLRALRLARKMGRHMPFSKDWAIDGSKRIYYKTIQVGAMSDTTKKFTLLEDFFFLEKELEEHVYVYQRFL